MNLITWNVLRHVGWQLLAAIVVAIAAALNHFDWSQLGLYAPLAQAIAAVIGAVVNEALGAAPPSKPALK